MRFGWRRSAYSNYIDPLLTNWPAAYHGGNYARLVSLKAQYDPDQLFRLPQGSRRARKLDSHPATI